MDAAMHEATELAVGVAAGGGTCASEKVPQFPILAIITLILAEDSQPSCSSTGRCV